MVIGAPRVFYAGRARIPVMQATPTPLANRLLIALPALGDPQFARSVALVCQHDTDSGMPAFEQTRPQRIVLPKKIINGVRLPACRPFAVGFGPAAHAFTMHALPRTPDRLGPDFDRLYLG